MFVLLAWEVLGVKTKLPPALLLFRVRVPLIEPTVPADRVPPWIVAVVVMPLPVEIEPKPLTMEPALSVPTSFRLV